MKINLSLITLITLLIIGCTATPSKPTFTPATTNITELITVTPERTDSGDEIDLDALYKDPNQPVETRVEDFNKPYDSVRENRSDDLG